MEHIEKTQRVSCAWKRESELYKLKIGHDAESKDSTGIKWVWNRNRRFKKLRKILGEKSLQDLVL